MIGNRPSAFVIAALGLCAAIAAASAQVYSNPDRVVVKANGAVDTLCVDSGRPVLRVVQTLERRYGYIITYEDPSYIYQGDVIDATKAVHRNGRVSGRPVRKITLPRATRLFMTIPASSCISQSEMAMILGRLVAAQDVVASGGHFRVQQTESGLFHVIPSKVRDQNGVWEMQLSPLDARISFPVKLRTAGQLIAEVAKSVSIAAHVDMSGMIGDGIMVGMPSRQRFKFQIGADDETAREVLNRMLEADPVRQTWTLTNGVELGPKNYVLSLVDVPAVCNTKRSFRVPSPHVSGCMSCSGPQ